MKRFTILNLMGVVVVLALGVAALRDADDLWAGGLLLATPFILCVNLVGGVCGQEGKRARRLGFATFGWAYFALAFLGLSEGNLALLPTTKLLVYIHRQVVGPAQMSFTFTAISATTVTGGGGTTTYSVGGIPTNVAGPGQMRIVQNASASAGPLNKWKVILPGATNYEAFQAVGHCLLALIAGLMGAFVGRRFGKGRRGELTNDQPGEEPTSNVGGIESMVEPIPK